MGLRHVAVGKDVPNDINVVIEIPVNGEAVKYEVDKDSGLIFVDRVLNTSMRYPCNYGFIPHTLCGDGDPADVLVIMPTPLLPGSVVRCRPIGMLQMTDESGEDAKIVAVPVSDVTGLYRNIGSIRDLPEVILDQIAHFFEHYKDLEKGKWVKVDGWRDADVAKQEILDSITNFEEAKEKPRF
ncbi:MAG TPA: inorganic diphosphatase [Gammaproteobacteria bacterium]|nr:inorganic diphosphatase [Xanthomonadales bacterium]MCB1593779.1 inorganic diphosphatase [Xanthomonadales bacterium]HOP21555.1 inorganic diphosphatase [Gammaproteobacteria bacterium]HPI94709.1 inorganic diphosphatase [Gammaproteobacteria bacterium]HPQ86154.1 inorganic diphosphatase [Gammaproteobacteria bacterium]